MIIEQIVYFEDLGKVNTEATLRLVRQKAKARGIKNIVIATHTGYTAERALEAFEDMPVSLTFVGSTKDRFDPNILKKVEASGQKVAFATEYGHELPAVANTVFRRFCEGMRVAIRVMLVAADLGLIPLDEPVIAVAGTGPVRFAAKGGGADTAIIVDPCTGEDFFKPRYWKQDRRNIREIICKPR
ncbi:MAG: hypothetical protein ACE5Z5_03580 [Candidatus Bathyarchaeia archaeon]